jgi:CheY-like chemotaxis protein
MERAAAAVRYTERQGGIRQLACTLDVVTRERTQRHQDANSSLVNCALMSGQGGETPNHAHLSIVSGQKTLTFVLNATMPDVDGAACGRVINDIIRLLGRTVFVTIEKIEEGSVRLTISFPVAAALELLELKRAGKLVELGGFSVLDVMDDTVSRPETGDASGRLHSAVTTLSGESARAPGPGQEATRAASKQSTWRTRTNRILIVDDNATNLKLVAYLMKAQGYDVDTALDAESAFEVIHQRQPEVILMNLQLPGIDGLELTRRIKADPGNRDIVIIAMTAYAMKGDQDRALAAGCDDYITKPIDTRDLPATIDRYLATRKTIRG